jgi:hypothetical protein
MELHHTALAEPSMRLSLSRLLSVVKTAEAYEINCIGIMPKLLGSG